MDTAHLSNNGFDLTIAPYSVWITYRRETAATAHTWDANVSGYKVLANGVVDIDAASIELCSETDQDLTPDWLMTLIEDRTPATW